MSIKMYNGIDRKQHRESRGRVSGIDVLSPDYQGLMTIEGGY